MLIGELGRARVPFGTERELQFRTMDVGEWLPPLDDPGDSIPNRTIDSVGLPEGELAKLGDLKERVYWARYESLLGDQWETRNSDDPTEPPRVEQLRKVDQSPGGLWRRLWRRRPKPLEQATNGPEL